MRSFCRWRKLCRRKRSCGAHGKISLSLSWPGAFRTNGGQHAAPPDVPVLVLLAHHNGDLAAGAQGDIPHQRAPVLDVPAVAVGAEIVVHPMQQRRVIGRVPVVHLLADVQVPVPRQRRGVVPVVRDQADVPSTVRIVMLVPPDSHAGRLPVPGNETQRKPISRSALRLRVRHRVYASPPTSARKAASRSKVLAAKPGTSLMALQMLILKPVRICPTS